MALIIRAFLHSHFDCDMAAQPMLLFRLDLYFWCV